MLLFIVGLGLAAGDIAATAVGEAANVLIIHGAQNWISTAQIAAFYRMKKSKANSSTAPNRTGTSSALSPGMLPPFNHVIQEGVLVSPTL
jgi:hypothetical protein